MKFTYFLLFAVFFFSCQTKNEKSNETTDSTATVASGPIVNPPTDSLSVYLPDTKSQFPKAETIKVANDPVFHQAKSYQAIPLIEVLEKFTRIKSLDVKQTQIIFECEDGYNPSMPLELALSRKSYLAIADNDAPKGQDWINAMKGTHEMKVAPFYVIYADVTPSERDFKWPYNLVKISLVETAKEFASVYPTDDDTMVKGFGIFQKNCMICHALNKVGGKMGPELNYPKNITEYWKGDAEIKAFIKNPTSFRNECKMPAVTYLSDKELDEVLRYLHYMVKHKV